MHLKKKKLEVSFLTHDINYRTIHIQLTLPRSLYSQSMQLQFLLLGLKDSFVTAAHMVQEPKTGTTLSVSPRQLT